MAELWAMLTVIGACLLGSFGPILIKKGTVRIHHTQGIKQLIISIITNWQLISGLALYGISALIFIPALRGGDLSVLYPLVSTSYIFVSIWSVLILHERMTRLKWFGIAVIIAGVVLVGLA